MRAVNVDFFRRTILFLFEGIDHLDALEISKFIDTVRRLANSDGSLEVSIKFDGSANLGFGLDDEGKLYFARLVKGQAEKKRGPNDWPAKPMFNPIRAATAALVASKDKIEKLLKPGDYINCEVLFESTPNSIEYGDNAIIFHDQNFSFLVSKLKNVVGKIDLYFYDQEKKNVTKKVDKVNFAILGKSVVNTKQYKISIAGDLARLEKFLSLPNKTFKDSTNFEVLKLKAAGENSAKIKKEKERLAAELKKTQINIKEKLIDQLLNKLPASDISPPPVFDKKGNNVGGSWPEGVVIKDIATGELSKITHVFPEINKFLWHYRHVAMTGHGPAGSFIPGIMTILKTDISDEVFKIPMLKIPGVINYVDKKYPDKPVNEKLLFFLREKNFNFSSINSSVGKFNQAIKKSLDSLDKLKEDFEGGGSDKTLKVRSGTFHRDVKYGPIQIRKTQETFLEVRRELEQMRKDILTIDSKTNEGKSVQLLRVFLGQRNLNKMAENKFKDAVLKYLFEAITGKKVGLIIGRMQPPTAGHYKIIEEAMKRNDKIYLFLAGNKMSEDNPVPFELRKKILSHLGGKVIIKKAITGFVPDLVEEFINTKGVAIINVYCGSDRVAGYESQVKPHPDHPVDFEYNVNAIKRDDNSNDPIARISGTKVRNSIKEGKFDEFAAMMSRKIPVATKKKYFDMLRKLIK